MRSSTQTGKPYQSKLLPHAELIYELHRRRRSLRRILTILEDEFDLRVSLSTLHSLAKKWGVRTSEALEQAVANALAEKPTDPVIRQELAEIKSLLLQVLEYGE